MPVQQQMSSFAKKLGAQVAAANAEHMDKPVDTGNRRLPSGIRDGIAKLSSMYTSEYKDGDLKGQTFFRASAIVMSPQEHNGEKIAGMVTSVMVPMCDIPAKNQRKAKSFSENWFEFQNVFKLLGVYPPDGKDGRPDYTDRAVPDRVAAGQMIEQYYFANMKALTDPQRIKTNPVYISFSTRGWTPPATPLKPKPEEMVFEDWHGLAELKAATDPGAGVTEGPPPVQPNGAPTPPHAPTQAAPPPQPATNGAAPPAAPTPQSAPSEMDPADFVAALVETVMNDPEGATEESRAAQDQLEKMAWGRGWAKDQTANAADWAAVGDMALNDPPPPAQVTAPTPGAAAAPSTNGATTNPTIAVGTKWMFAKRTKDGAKLKDNKGQEFPPQEVEVVTIDLPNKVCTLKTTRDGKPVNDIRTKQPVAVKLEWLEPTIPY